MGSLIRRMLSSALFATSVVVTLVLIVVGYELAVWLLSGGSLGATMAMVVLAAGPSVCALGSLPFWLTLQRMNRQG